MDLFLVLIRPLISKSVDEQRSKIFWRTITENRKQFFPWVKLGPDRFEVNRIKFVLNEASLKPSSHKAANRGNPSIRLSSI